MHNLLELFKIENWILLYGFATEQPILLGSVVVIGLIVSWAFGNLIRFVFKPITASPLEGWRTDARDQSVTHELGIGATDVKVLKMNGKLRAGILFGILFFGLGIPFLRENLLVGAISAAFVFLGLIIQIVGFKRFELHNDKIVRKGLFWPTREYFLSQLRKAGPLRDNAALALRLEFQDGRKLTITAQYSGYPDFLIWLGERYEPAWVYGALAPFRKRTIRSKNA